MRFFTRSMVLLLFFSLTVLVFQNCSPGFNAINESVLNQSYEYSLTSSWGEPTDLRDQDIQILTDSFHPNDMAKLGAGQPAEFNFYNAVPDFFGGKNKTHLGEFVQHFTNINASSFGSASTTFPGCGDKTNALVTVYTYSKPYQTYQKEFLTWTKNKLGTADFLPPKARANNTYTDNKKCPVFDATSTTESALQATQGQAIYKDSDNALTLVMDNRYNPYRWMAPINEVHHIEAPSLALVVRSPAKQIVESEESLNKYLNSASQEELILSYDVELEVEDHSGSMQENTYQDILAGSNGQDFLSTFLNDVNAFTSDSRVGGGHKLTVQKYLNTRVLPKTFQFSLMVNWKEADGVYRLSEFMLASQNYKSSHLPDYQISPQTALNPYFLEGGNGGNVGWHRMNVDGLNLFRNSHPELQALSPGTRHFEISGASFKQRLTGTVNLSKYYKLARELQFFPGQRSSWGNGWIGFDGDVAEFKNPSERHGIHWIGAIFEAHGPYKVRLKVKDLKMQRQEGASVVVTPTATPTPEPEPEPEIISPVENTPASCSFNGVNVPHGQNVTAYAAANVGFGSTCQSQKRICNNGVLSGSYNAVSCSVAEGSPSASVNTVAPIGTMDLLTLVTNNSSPALLVEGWAYDADAPEKPLMIHFYANAPFGLGGQLVGVATANLPRPDLNKAGYSGNHGFSFKLPTVFNGTKIEKVYGYAIDASENAGHHLNRSPLDSP